MDYVKSEEYQDCWVISKKFNTTTYYVYLSVEFEKLYVAMANSKKKKYKSFFEEHPQPTDGGIPALLWVKDAMLQFPEWYKSRYKKELKFIYLKGSDSRRQRVYKYFLNKCGFYTERTPDYGIVLCKRL